MSLNVNELFTDAYRSHQYKAIFPSLTKDECFQIRAHIFSIDWNTENNLIFDNAFSNLNIMLQMNPSVEFAKAYQRLISDSGFTLRIKVMPRMFNDNNGVTLVENFYDCHISSVSSNVNYDKSNILFKKIEISSSSHKTLFVHNGKILQ